MSINIPFESLSPKQEEIFDDIMHFFLNTKDMAYVFSGVAGSGKTTIIRHINYYLNSLGYEVFNVALTGKAASNLATKFRRPYSEKSSGAFAKFSTIHSLLYDPIFDSEKNVIGWSKRKAEDVRSLCQMIIVDEASMVSREIFDDLVDVGIPILFVGDSEQLPPINDDGGAFSIMSDPDSRLEEIHRQAEYNPIIQLSRDILVTGRINRKFNDQNHINIINKNVINKEFVRQVGSKIDVSLCGINRTRRQYNRLWRAAQGFHEEYAQPGETIVCLKNTREYKKPIYNGEQFKVEKCQSVLSDVRKYSMTNILSEYQSRFNDVLIHDDSWYEMPPKPDTTYSYFSFGYWLTVHKAQGSEFNNVLFIDEDVSRFLDSRRFRYTAVTRAVENITIGM